MPEQMRHVFSCVLCLVLVAGCAETPPPPAEPAVKEESEEGSFCERNTAWCIAGGLVVLATAASVLSESDSPQSRTSTSRHPCSEDRTILLNGERVHANPECR